MRDQSTAIFNEEFARRQKQKEEEQFYANMDKEQKAVNKLWDAMNSLYT